MVAVVGVQNTNPAKLAEPPLVVTFTPPLVPTPTIAVMVVSFTTEKLVAAVPPKLTAVAPVKYLPFIVTVVPVAAVVGVIEVIVGVDKQVVGMLAIKLPRPLGCVPTAKVEVTVLVNVLMMLVLLLPVFVT